MHLYLLLVVLITICAPPLMGHPGNSLLSCKRRQEEEIKVLKTLLEEEKKFSKQLSGRISQLEAITNPSSMENDQLLARPKRPYRLLPPYIPK